MGGECLTVSHLHKVAQQLSSLVGEGQRWGLREENSEPKKRPATILPAPYYNNVCAKLTRR